MLFVHLKRILRLDRFTAGLKRDTTAQPLPPARCADAGDISRATMRLES
jgi:hypothetical protein